MRASWSKHSTAVGMCTVPMGSAKFRWILPFWVVCFLLGDKASLALPPKRKQKYKNGNIYQKLRVPTSEREGKLSNPQGRTGTPGRHPKTCGFDVAEGRFHGRFVTRICPGSRIRSQIWPGTSSSMWFFEVAISEIAIVYTRVRFFKFVWEILPIQPTIHIYNPGHDTRVLINACLNIWLTQKNST
jgi:hypothetical protein